MVLNNELLRKKISYLGMSVSKNIACKQSERMILFESVNDIVFAYTSDGVNNIRVEIGPATTDFYAIVDYSTFSNFIKSCDGDITLEAKSKFLYIKASNVKCKIPTYNHETKRGNTGIPNPDGNYNYNTQLTETIDLSLIKSILDPNHIVEIYQKIYFGESIMASDTDNIVMKQTRVFDRDILLNLSSVEILSAISNVTYTYYKTSDIYLLCVKSDELIATMAITENDKNDFQYDDLAGLYNEIQGASVTLDTKVLAKAISASSLFMFTPHLVFNAKGIFVQIDSVEFIYKISEAVCEDRVFELSANLVKKLTTMGQSVLVYYTNKDLIKCEVGDIKEILSIAEVANNE